MNKYTIYNSTNNYKSRSKKKSSKSYGLIRDFGGKHRLFAKHKSEALIRSKKDETKYDLHRTDNVHKASHSVRILMALDHRIVPSNEELRKAEEYNRLVIKANGAGNIQKRLTKEECDIVVKNKIISMSKSKLKKTNKLDHPKVLFWHRRIQEVLRNEHKIMANQRTWNANNKVVHKYDPEELTDEIDKML